MADPKGVSEAAFAAACKELNFDVVERKNGSQAGTRFLTLRHENGAFFIAFLAGPKSDNYLFLNLFMFIHARLTNAQILAINRAVAFVKIVPDDHEPDLIMVELDVATVEMSQFQLTVAIVNFIRGLIEVSKRSDDMGGHV